MAEDEGLVKDEILAAADDGLVDEVVDEVLAGEEGH